MLGDKSVTLPPCSQLITHGLVWNWTSPSAVKANVYIFMSKITRKLLMCNTSSVALHLFIIANFKIHIIYQKNSSHIREMSYWPPSAPDWWHSSALNEAKTYSFHVEICALPGHYAAYSFNSSPTFRENLSVSSSRNSWPLKMVPIGFPETS